MIKINLLNSYKEAVGNSPGAAGVFVSDSDEKRQILIDFAKRIIVLIIGPIGFYIYELNSIPVIQAQLDETNAKVAELQQFNNSKKDLAEEIKKYEDAQGKFNAQMDFINKITRDKVNEYKLFQHLKESTPDSVWINKLRLTESTLMITAESDEPKAIDTFIKMLSNADFISNLIPLTQSNQKDFAGIGVTTTLFTIKAQLGSGNPQ